MSPQTPTWKSRLVESLTVLARWALGAFFIYMGMKKALEPSDFLKLVREYHMLTNPYLLNLVAAGLPWFEVFCGLLLLTGVAVRGAAVMLITMLVPFTIVVTLRALDIAAIEHKPFCLVKFDCGCGAGEIYICNKLVENTVQLLLACWLLTGRGRSLAAWFSIFKAPAAEPGPTPNWVKPA